MKTTTTTYTGADAASYCLGLLNAVHGAISSQAAIDAFYKLADVTGNAPVLSVAIAYDNGSIDLDRAARYCLEHLFRASAHGTLTVTL